MTETNLPFSPQYFTQMTISVQRRAEMLEKTQLGKGLEWSEILTLCGYLDAWQGAVGGVVCEQGDHSSYLAIVCQGRVDVLKKDLKQADKIIASLGPGNSLGEMSLIDREPRSATAVVHTPVQILVLAEERFQLLAEDYPRLWGKVLLAIARILSRRLRQTSGILAEYLES